jgi:DNA-binding response OmpR family regulator
MLDKRNYLVSEIRFMKKRVMIFDDDADILEVCTIVLEESGFEVQGQLNCERMQDKIARFDPHVVLIDNRIPPEGGIIASREIRATERYKTLPIVFFSANKNVATMARDATADFFLEKPFDVDTLSHLIQKAALSGQVESDMHSSL